MIAVVESGALLGDLDDALAAHGLMLGHDPWSRPIATVGGAISTDGVGYLAAAYGSMGEQVIGLEAALATGELLDARAVSLRAGPRLDHALIGAEGALGVITAAVLRVFPRPETRTAHALRFESFAAGFGAVGAMARAGIRPSMIDLTEERGECGSLDTTLYLCFEGPPRRRANPAHRGAPPLPRAWGPPPRRRGRTVLERAPRPRRSMGRAHRGWPPPRGGQGSRRAIVRLPAPLAAG